MLAHSKIRMDDGRELIEDWTLETDGHGNFRLEHTNNHELGKEAVLLDGILFTRHRWGTFLERGADPKEAERLREEAWGVLASYLDLLQAWLDVRRENGRLVLSKARKPHSDARRHGDRPERRWRDTVKVQALRGWVLLDGEVATDAELRASYSFRRDDVEGKADLEYTRYLTRGSPIIARPDSVPSPIRLRLEPERKKLLGKPKRKPGAPPPAPPRPPGSRKPQ